MNNADIVKIYPRLAALDAAPTLQSYLEPILEWRIDESAFSHRKLLIDRIINKVTTLYGADIASALKLQLSKHSHADTGPHLHLPRDLDRISQVTMPHQNMNTLVVQSICLTTSLYAVSGLNLKLSLFTGIVPATNSNSAAYLQLSSDSSNAVRLVSNKYKSSIQAFMPPFGKEAIEAVSKSATALAEKDRQRALKVTEIWGKHDNFSDQVSASSAFLYDDIQKSSNVRHVNLDLLQLSDAYFLELLEDESSVISRIFCNETTAQKFTEDFSNIGTGWKSGESPFVKLRAQSLDSGTVYSADGNYEGPLDRSTLAAGIRKRELIPRGALMFFCLLIEGGLLVTGGMFQSEYCTELRDRSIPLLRALGEEARAEAMQGMPVTIAVTTPIWGMKDGEPLNYGALLGLTLSKDHVQAMLQIRGADALGGAIPSLAALRGEKAGKQDVNLLDFSA